MHAFWLSQFALYTIRNVMASPLAVISSYLAPQPEAWHSQTCSSRPVQEDRLHCRVAQCISVQMYETSGVEQQCWMSAFVILNLVELWSTV